VPARLTGVCSVSTMNPVSVITVTSEVRVELGNRGFRNLPGEPALRGDWERSARFEGAATFHFAQLGWPLDPADKAYVKSVSARTRAALGDARFEQLLATGRELALDEALAQMQQYVKEEP